MNFLCAQAGELPQPLVDSLARYRYQVFVERLGWELPAAPGYEQDQFDHAGTVHIVARSPQGQIVGCGRLLPTTGPYLLESVFPQLFNGLPIPRHEQVWELSRFAAMDVDGGQPLTRADYMAERVLLQALRFCHARGVTHLLAVSTPPVERLLLRAGVECQRLGPPDIIGGQPVLAFVIRVSDVSIQALGAFETAAEGQTAPVRPPRCDGAQALHSLVAMAHAQWIAAEAQSLVAGAVDAAATAAPGLHGGAALH